jgi:spermidine synthase
VSAAIGGAAAVTCLLAAFQRGDPPAVGGQKVLVRRDTPYHHIEITQLDQTRFMRFDALTQGGVNLAHPERSVFFYDEGLLLSYVLRPGMRRVLVIGLGGGTLPRSIARHLPDAEIDSVEIDPVVRELALKYFLYQESPRIRTFIEDGRTFISRPGPEYDLIILDAFNSTGVPFHLTTREFFEALRRRLSPDGVFAANFIGRLMGRDGALFWSTYQTIRRRFGQVYVTPDVRTISPAKMDNVLVFATVSADPMPIDAIRRRTDEVGKQWGLSYLRTAAERLIHSPDPPESATELTDAYAPVEALQNF